MKKKWWMILLFFAFVLIILVGANYIHDAHDKQKQIEEKYGTRDFYNYCCEREKLPFVNPEVSLIIVGDISYSRGVERIIKQKNDVDYPFKAISGYIKNSDIAFANLESPLTDGDEMTFDSMLFRSNPITAYALKHAGIDIVSLANNHSMNFGTKGLIDTFTALRNAGIRYAGAGENIKEAYEPVYIVKSGIRFAFLAYVDSFIVPDSYKATITNSGVAVMNSSLVKERIRKAKRTADFVIVSMHAGTEYSNLANEMQKEFAHAAIDAGADLVIGQHPHVVQPIEKYKGKYIFYSLGNFVFDQYRSKNMREGLMIRVYFSKKKINRIILLPVFTEHFAQPQIAAGEKRDAVLKKSQFQTDVQNVYYCNDSSDIVERTRNVIYTNSESTVNNISKTSYDDLDGDMVPEKYILRNGRLTICSGSAIEWKSPLSWWIDDFKLADSNNDGIKDINVSLWKAGNYGKYMPIWVKENDMSIKNHFFILDYSKGRVRHVWCSSNLAQPNCEFEFADINKDLKNELIVVEGNYGGSAKNQGRYVAVWKWNGWGFSNEWRSQKGYYKNLTIENAGGTKLIVLDCLNKNIQQLVQ